MSVTTSQKRDYLSIKPKFSQSNQYTWNLLQSTAITFLDDGFRIFLECFYLPVSDCFRPSFHLYVRCMYYTTQRRRTFRNEMKLYISYTDYKLQAMNSSQKCRCVRTAFRKRIPSGSILLGHHELIMGDAYNKESESSGIESIVHPKRR